VELSLPVVWAHLSAAAAGAAMPQIGASVRARWSVLLPDKADLRVAFAFESVADEVVFILGPTLVTVLATAVHPLAGLTSAVVASLVGTIALVAQKRTEPPVASRERRLNDAAFPWRLLAPLVACAVVLGFMLGGTEVAIVAFSDERGHTAVAGLMLAIWALGSLLAGVATGAMPTGGSNAARFRWGLLALAVLTLPLPFVASFPALAVVLFLGGFAISPTLIAGFAWVEETVPASRTTEGITLFVTGLGVGVAPGAAVIGRVVDMAGASASLGVTAAAGVLGACLGLTTRWVSREGPAPT
jgi:predicted MFS family arabinose efflux permease